METITDYRCTDCGSYLWSAPQLEPIADPNAIQLETVVLACPTCDRPRCCVCKAPYGLLFQIATPGRELTAPFSGRCDEHRTSWTRCPELHEPPRPTRPDPSLTERTD